MVQVAVLIRIIRVSVLTVRETAFALVLPLAKGPVTFELVLLEDIGRDELGVDGVLGEHDEGVEQQFSLIFVEFLVVVEGDVEFLEDGDGLQEEGDVEFGEEDARQADVCFVLLVASHYAGVLPVELADEV